MDMAVWIKRCLMFTWCVHVYCIAMVSHISIWLYDELSLIGTLPWITNLGNWGLVWEPYHDSSLPKVSPIAWSQDEPDGRFGTQLDNLHFEVATETRSRKWSPTRGAAWDDSRDQLIKLVLQRDRMPSHNKDSGSNAEMPPFNLVPTANQAQRGVCQNSLRPQKWPGKDTGPKGREI